MRGRRREEREGKRQIRREREREREKGKKIVEGVFPIKLKSLHDIE